MLSGTKPVVIDLFAGAGGLSLGASRAGFYVCSSVEIDRHAIETHSKNFPSCIHISEDVASLSGRRLLELSNVSAGGLDGLIGGPPCQGFSHIGRNDVQDERNSLFTHFFRLVSETKPKFFVAENVPGILHSKYDGIRNEAFEYVKDYVLLKPLKVTASDFGAPTTRTRVFFIGYNSKHISTDFDAEIIKMAETKSDDVRVGRALQGLPVKISPEWQTEASGWRGVDVCGYHGRFGHKLCGEIPESVGYAPAIERLHEKREVSGCIGTRHSNDVEDRYRALLPREVDRITRSPRLDAEWYCPTLRAGTGPEHGSYQAVRPIHPTEARVITPREAARLQGFPDWFVFHATKWHSFRQIGNSVCPIVAEEILKLIYSAIGHTS